MIDHLRSIDRWMKYVAIFGPMVSGIVFGGAGYVVGYTQAKQEIRETAQRVGSLEGWKIKQDEFNLVTVRAITRLKAIVKDTQP